MNVRIECIVEPVLQVSTSWLVSINALIEQQQKKEKSVCSKARRAGDLYNPMIISYS